MTELGGQWFIHEPSRLSVSWHAVEISQGAHNQACCRETVVLQGMAVSFIRVESWCLARTDFLYALVGRVRDTDILAISLGKRRALNSLAAYEDKGVHPLATMRGQQFPWPGDYASDILFENSIEREIWRFAVQYIFHVAANISCRSLRV